jgi:hypothetical protein
MLHLLHASVRFCGLFTPESPAYVPYAPQIGDLVKEVEPYAGLWHVVSEYALKTEDWMYGNMQTLNPEEIDELVSKAQSYYC